MLMLKEKLSKWKKISEIEKGRLLEIEKSIQRIVIVIQEEDKEGMKVIQEVETVI